MIRYQTVYTCSSSNSTYSWNLPQVIKKYSYFYGSIFIRKSGLLLRIPPGENSNIVSRGVVGGGGGCN